MWLLITQITFGRIEVSVTMSGTDTSDTNVIFISLHLLAKTQVLDKPPWDSNFQGVANLLAQG
jgi:hypothetical protein